MIWAVGELALHIFVEDAAGSRLDLAGAAHVQLGGGASMVAQALHQRRLTDGCGLIGVVGGDGTGRLLTGLARSRLTHVHIAVDDDALSSVVYLHVSGNGLDHLSICPGGVEIDNCLPLISQVQPTDPVYCPAFPGHDKVLRELSGRTHALLIDVGFAPWTGNMNRIVEAIDSAPPCAAMLINGAELGDDQIVVLSERALKVARNVVITAKDRPALARTGEQMVWVAPPQTAARSTVGAGDVFASGLLSGSASDSEDFVDTCRNASQLAAAFVGGWGFSEHG